MAQEVPQVQAADAAEDVQRLPQEGHQGRVPRAVRGLRAHAGQRVRDVHGGRLAPAAGRGGGHREGGGGRVHEGEGGGAEGAQGEGEEGEIRIGFVGSAMQRIIPELLEQMSKIHPNIHASLDELDNKDQLDAIARDKLDIGFVRLESVHKGFEQRVVLEDSFSLVVSNKHAVQPRNFKSLDQFKDEQFILFSNDYSQEYYDNIMSIFTDHGFEPKVSHRSVQANSIFRLVERQLGVAIVPTALQGGLDLGLSFISLNHLPQRTKLIAIWSDDNRNEALSNFLALM